MTFARKLTVQDYRDIRASPLGVRALARKYKVAMRHIERIREGYSGREEPRSRRQNTPPRFPELVVSRRCPKCQALLQFGTDGDGRTVELCPAGCVRRYARRVTGVESGPV